MRIHCEKQGSEITQTKVWWKLYLAMIWLLAVVWRLNYCLSSSI